MFTALPSESCPLPPCSLLPAPCPLSPVPCSLLPASGKLCPGSRWPAAQARIPSRAARGRARWPEVRSSVGLYCHYGCRRASRARPAMVSVGELVRCLGRFPDLWPKRLERPHRLDRVKTVWGCILPYAGGAAPTRERVLAMRVLIARLYWFGGSFAACLAIGAGAVHISEPWMQSGRYEPA